jgi:hypothetical protein
MDEDNPFMVASLPRKESSMAPETETPGPSLPAQHSSSTTTSVVSPSLSPSTTNQIQPSPFDKFLDLRKKLRRAIFKSEEVRCLAHDMVG